MTSVRPSLKILIASAAFVFVASQAFAQAIDIPMIVTGGGGDAPDTWVTASYAYQVETRVDNPTRAKFSRNNTQFVAGHRFEMSDDVFFVLNGAYQGSYYNISRGSSGGAFLRWSDIHRTTLMGGVGWQASDDWTLIFLGLVRTDGESGADFDDTLTGGGAFVADYKWNDNLSTGLIIGAISVLEDSAGLIPIPTVDWTFADDWKLHFGVVSAAGYPGVGPEVSYTGETWMFGFGGSFQNRRFRLDSDSGQASSKGIGQETSFPVFGRVGFRPTEKITLSATAGVALGGEIRSGTDGGRKLYKDDYDAAPIVGFQANFLF